MKTRRTVSVILCIVLVFSCFSVQASADGIAANFRSLWQRILDFYDSFFAMIKGIFDCTPDRGGEQPEIVPPEVYDPDCSKPVDILESEIVCEIKKSSSNPRNSEGDFAVHKNGNILFSGVVFHSFFEVIPALSISPLSLFSRFPALPGNRGKEAAGLRP